MFSKFKLLSSIKFLVSIQSNIKNIYRFVWHFVLKGGEKINIHIFRIANAHAVQR